MNYYEARHRGNGEWDFTVRRKGHVFLLGYCADAGGGHHATAHEARSCYKAYLLDTQFKPDQAALLKSPVIRCQARDCDDLADHMINIGHYHRFFLCSAHLTREAIEPIMEVESFYGSY